MTVLKTIIFTIVVPGTVTVLTKELVVRGLYRCVRNPMVVGVLFLIVGEAVLFESSLLFGYAGLLFLAFHLFIVFYEEPTLRQTFGATYERYCEAVPRWIPRVVLKSSVYEEITRRNRATAY